MPLIDPDRPVVNDRYRVALHVSRLAATAPIAGRKAPFPISVKHDRYGPLKRLTLRLAPRTDLASVCNGLMVPAAGSKP